MRKKSSLYLIVCAQEITIHERFARPKASCELDRIMKEEDYVLLEEDTPHIPKSLTKDRLILVCGKYREICVQNVCESLKRKGYRAKIYEMASFRAFD